MPLKFLEESYRWSEVQINPYSSNGANYWRIDVNPNISTYEQFDFPGGAYAAIGLDPGTQTYKIVYLLYPQSVWTPEELENNEQIKKLLQKCNVCSVLNQIKDSTGGLSSAIRPPGKMLAGSSASAYPSPVSTSSTAQPAEAISSSMQPVEAVRPSAGDMVQPRYLPVIANLGKTVFCTTLGSMTVSALMSLLTDLMAGWAKDEGHRKAFQDMSDEFISGANICPADAPKVREDIKKLYEAYKKDGMVPALKAGMIKDVATALKDNGINVGADVTIKTRAQVGVGRRSLVD